MKILPAADKEQVKRYSSINQFTTMLSVQKKGEWVPIVYDKLESVDCNGHIKSHKAMLNIRPWSGHYFPVKDCRYKNTTYITGDYEDTHFKPNPDGSITEINEKKQVAVAGGNGVMLGITQEKTLRVGQDYVWSDHMLESVD